MIFGKTYLKKYEEAQVKMCVEREGVKLFAWRPVKLYDGSYVWLQSYWRFLEASYNRDTHRWEGRYNFTTYTYHLDADSKHMYKW